MLYRLAESNKTKITNMANPGAIFRTGRNFKVRKIPNSAEKPLIFSSVSWSPFGSCLGQNIITEFPNIGQTLHAFTPIPGAPECKGILPRPKKQSTGLFLHQPAHWCRPFESRTTIKNPVTTM